MAGYEDATPAQVEYIRGLAHQAKTIMERSPNTLTRNEAAEIIDALKGRIRGDKPVFEELEDDEPTRPTPIRNPLMDRWRAYDELEARLMEGAVRATRNHYGHWYREPPSYRGRPVIWKEGRNTQRSNGIHYGWRWMCAHPKHKHPVFGQSSSRGQPGCLSNALLHWWRHHRDNPQDEGPNGSN